MVLVVFVGCTKQEVNSVSEYSKWINNAENGLIKIKKIKGLEIAVKYLPTEYLILKELEESDDTSENNRERIKKEYENAITFLMTIGPDENKKNNNDIMFEGIKSYKEYSERLVSMNFEIDKNVSLNTTHAELKPVLAVLENTYGLSKSRNIMFVFSPNESEKKDMKTSNNIDFVYSDELFSLGIMHFSFDYDQLENLPHINRNK